MSSIVYYNRKEIDTVRWDHCIDSAANPLIYPKSVFLDSMCDHWGAFIFGDYEAVMPIPWKKKFGIRYSYQPPFCQQLGIFGTSIGTELIFLFLEELKKRFRFAEIALNFNNSIRNSIPRINYCLDLSGNYEEIQQAFKPTLKNHVRRAEHFSLCYERNADLQECFTAFSEDIKLKQAGITNADLMRFQKLCGKLGSGSYIIRKVTNQNGENCSMGLLMLDSKRLYNILSITTEQGRRLRSNHFMLTKLIHEFAGSGKCLDFEGSMLPGVKVFFESFGAFNQPYYLYRHNHLPFPLRLFKR